MKLNKSQKEAVEFFKDNDYLVINAARQTGKTTVLREIIKRNKGKRIGVVTITSSMFRDGYKDLDVKYISFEKKRESNKFDIIIGDEVSLLPSDFKCKIACACTGLSRSRFEGFEIKNLEVNFELADRMKKTLNGQDFKKEYGKYINKK